MASGEAPCDMAPPLAAFSRRFCQYAVLIAVIVVVAPTTADALPLALYRYEAQAQTHCPEDTVVWLDFRKGVYYLKRQKRYGRGTAGLFVCRREASDSGFRRSLLGRR